MSGTRHTAAALVGVAALIVAALAGPAAGVTSVAQDNETATATPTPEPTPTPTPRVGNATVTVDDQVAVDEITVAEASLEAGGYLVVKNASDAVIGTSAYLEPGTQVTNRTVSLDVTRESAGVVFVEVWFDDGDQTFNASADNPYTTGGFPVRDTAFAAVESLDRPTPTETATATPTATATATPMGTMNGGEETTAETTGASTPGFTGLAAVAALAALAALALRRR